MDVGDEQQKVFCSPGQFGNFVLLLLWHILHFIISIWYCVLGIAHVLESYLASSGLLKRYGVVNLDKLRYLAVVVDNDEAYQTSKVTELLQWLAVVGVKNVCLYDAEGVLKKSKEAILGKLHVAKLFKETTKNVPLLDQQQIHLEFASYSDGKEAVAKAANLLFVKYYLGRDQEEPIFTESHIAEALGTVGSEGPDPDLILIYGPARCHLGFPAWRIRYTEIVFNLVEYPKGEDEEGSNVLQIEGVIELDTQNINKYESSFSPVHWTGEVQLGTIGTHGTVEVHEIWLPNKSIGEVHNGSPELR